MDLSLIQRREFLAGLAGATAAAASLCPGGQPTSLLAADPPRGGDTPSGLAKLAFRPLPSARSGRKAGSAANSGFRRTA